MADVQNENLLSITYQELFDEWLNLKDLSRINRCNIINFIVKQRNMYQRDIQRPVINLIKNIEKRWKSCKRSAHKFRSRNKAWLKLKLVFPEIKPKRQDAGPSKVGRPSKNFTECGTRAKQKKIYDLTSTTTTEQLSFATEVSLRKSGHRDAATIVHDVTKISSPERAKKYKAAYNLLQSGKQAPIPLSSEEALSLIINTKSSKATYLAYRMAAKHSNANIFPSWQNILAAKNACYPNPSSITVEHSKVEIKLEDLLHLTAKRIFQLQADVLSSFLGNRLDLICKWGLDGSSGQSNYRQVTKIDANDSSVLIISLVPLQLRDSQDNTKILWQNPVPSSTRFCRAVKFMFAKETPTVTRSEVEKIQAQIFKLSDLMYNDVSISFTLLLTMVDGKICNTVTETKSARTCYICQANPKEMNDLTNVEKKLAKTENYSFGLSTLHSWIRFFECCLHIGYRMEIKCWQARGENKHKMEVRKQHIIEGLRKELGILVDMPKPGYGSTNTGNTARQFFQNAKKSAEITGVDENIIHRFYIILQTISCGYQVHPEKFKIYATDTAKEFVLKYPWFYMPMTVHKVLIHGAEIIKYVLLPIGQLGEEAQEAKNKDFKFIREHRTRKDSAEHTNYDLFNYFILSSDPLISHLALKNKGKKGPKLHNEVVKLLMSPNTTSSFPELSDSDSE